MDTNLTYYSLLGVSENATADEIRKAYRNEIKKWHPDINTDKNAEQITKALNEAKSVLLDPYKRSAYDRELKRNREASYNDFKSRTNPKKEKPKTNTSNTTPQSSFVVMTKWQYLFYWMRYSTAGIFRKIVGFIGVLLSTALCFTINILLYLIELFLRGIHYVSSLAWSLAAGLVFLVFVACFISVILQSYELFNETHDWGATFQLFLSLVGEFINEMVTDGTFMGTVALVIFGLMFLTLLMLFIEKAFSQKVYEFFSYKLNQILFDKCVGSETSED